MPNLRNRFPARRRFLKQSAALTASASLAVPVLALAQGTPPADAAAEGRKGAEAGSAKATDAAGVAHTPADRATADAPPPARSLLTLRARKA
ncbi:MAG: twin-arginine translocation signal domain-containing protein [Burkholderiaceae bacterium]|nr:twin-arginine translocation signal domain-containing protein [Burkholderiaceae bacterium]